MGLWLPATSSEVARNREETLFIIRNIQESLGGQAFLFAAYTPPGKLRSAPPHTVYFSAIVFERSAPRFRPSALPSIPASAIVRICP